MNRPTISKVLNSLAHITDIFALAVVPGQIVSGSGSSSIKIHSTSEQDFPLNQTLQGAHKLGCHHLVASKDGLKLASAGFEGQCIIWNVVDGEWQEEGRITGKSKLLVTLLLFLLIEQMATKPARLGQ